MKQETPWYNRIEAVFIIVLLSVMTVIMFFSVVSRYFFKFTFSWAEQVTRIMFVWCTFAGISLAALKGSHMRVSAISLLLGEKLSKYVFWFGNIVASVFGFGISYYMYNCMMNAFRNNQTFTAVPGLNVGFMYLAGVIGMIGFGIRCLQGVVSEYRASKKEEDKTA